MPREKLSHAGIEELSNSDLLALIFSVGNRKESVMQMAQRAIKDYTVNALLHVRDYTKLSEALDLPPVKAMQLLAAVELGRRLFKPSEHTKLLLNSPEKVVTQFQHLREKSREELWAVYLNTRQLLLGSELLAMGSKNMLIAEPGQILSLALELNASGIILLHNHPSGSIEPSEPDLDFTNRVVSACRLLQIQLVDHIIIGQGYYSFAEQGILSNESAFARAPD